MKFIISICLATVVLCAAPTRVTAQTTNLPTAPAQDELGELMQAVQAKIDIGKTSEADFADELKKLDAIIGANQATNADVTAKATYLKGSLYLQVLKKFDKSAEIFKQIAANYPDTRYGKSATEILPILEKQVAAQKIQDRLVPGTVFPDFAEIDLTRQPLSVGALKGKVVLVDFWATWCPPCRAELPNVIATYKKHHGDGFEIIGVSLDSKREQLESFLKDNPDLAWPQFFDGNGEDKPNWDNRLAVKYGVQAIPFTILIGPDGKILGKNLLGQELENAVNSALMKK